MPRFTSDFIESTAHANELVGPSAITCVTPCVTPINQGTEPEVVPKSLGRRMVHLFEKIDKQQIEPCILGGMGTKITAKY